jgi:hypothetical protein
MVVAAMAACAATILTCDRPCTTSPAANGPKTALR